MEALGIETGDTSAPIVVDRCESDAKDATQGDAKRRKVSASGDDVEAALAKALEQAVMAGRFDVVALIAAELHARRLAREGVAILDGRRPSRSG